MTFLYPAVVAVAVLLAAAATAGYVALQRRRSAALAAAGFKSLNGGGVRKHLPTALLLAALPVMLVGLARPQAEVAVPRVAGTVLLAFDISNSMSAADVAPTRLGAAQEAAKAFVADQPDTVDVGVLVFGDQALLTQAPSDDHAAAIAAIGRVSPSGGTSLGQAILVALGTITGKPVTLPSPEGPHRAHPTSATGRRPRSSSSPTGRRPAGPTCRPPPSSPRPPACGSRPSASAPPRARPSRWTASSWAPPWTRRC
ncbi:VWA domain-containing protein [Actinoplanes sp. CA-252034]|uniref:VWA domain-containing protein n=1 Tax=Actinoplanes sp. CA-252034 TaxID=3239906 RepID=UPI003D9623AD